MHHSESYFECNVSFLSKPTKLYAHYMLLLRKLQRVPDSYNLLSLFVLPTFCVSTFSLTQSVSSDTTIVDILLYEANVNIEILNLNIAFSSVKIIN